MKIAFIIPPAVELLDLAGPVQVFTEAKFYGHPIDMEFYCYQDKPVSTSGLGLGKLLHYKQARLKEGDFVFFPGMDQQYVRSHSFKAEKELFMWLKECADKKITTCSVCNGAFALGYAGLLNDVECTTHWRRVDELQAQFPKAKVLTDIIYVKNSHVYTSAGISAGIDLALSVLEDVSGPQFTNKVARGLVVYYRRNGRRKQETIYLDFREHINGKIHEVQDYLVDHVGSDNSITNLAEMVGMSPRNLSRVFKEATGTTIVNYLTQLRLAHAKTMLKNSENSMHTIARHCGFKTVRQLQRILKLTSGSSH
ncbi:MAG TPA: AraC family transcriptional regulator [Cytophagales bacterium]|nr:AraC family transcriptional regulator [Cytophagales bacterium]